MLSGRNRKNSILSLALMAILSSALFFVSGGFVSAKAETAEYYLHKYVVAGVNAYEYDYDKTTMSDVEACAQQYDISVKGDDGTLDKSFDRMESYFALQTAVDEYNANHSANSGYTLSVKDEYTPKITYDKAYEDIAMTASGWENAYEGDYEVKYTLTNSGASIMNVLAMGVNGSFAVEATDDGITVNGKGASWETQEIRFTYNDTKYNVTVSLRKKTQQNGAEEGFSSLTVYETATIKSVKADGLEMSSHNFAVENLVQEQKIQSILNSAKKYFGANPDKENYTQAEQEYNNYKTAITKKVESIKAAAKVTLVSYFDQTLYKVSDLTLIESRIDALVEGGYNSYKDYFDKAKIFDYVAVSDYPTIFKEQYGEIISKTSCYTETQKADAIDAMEELLSIDGNTAEYVSPETLSNYFEQTKQIIFENLKNTVSKEVVELVGQIDTEGFSPYQRMEVTYRYVNAVNEINDYVDYNDYLNVVNFIPNFDVSDLVAGTETEINKDGVTVEIIGAKFVDGSSIEFASENEIVEQPQDVVNGKKTNVDVRKLNAINSFDIKVKDGYNGEYVNFAVSGVQYKVTVKLSQETLDYLSSDGYDTEAIRILHVDKDGNSEVIIVEFNKSEGTIMFTTTHFSTFYLMGNTSNLAFQKVANLLSAFAGLENILIYALIGLGAIVGVVLLFTVIAFFVSICTKYKIKFVTNGGTKVKKLRRRYGRKLPEFVTPTKEGYVFSGWCIDKTLKYEFNRNVMPRSNVTLYARWIKDEDVKAQEQNEMQTALVAYYDRLRAKLIACKKPVKQGEKSFVAQEILAKLFAEQEQVKLLVKTKLANLKEEDGVVSIVADADKYEEFVVTDEATFNIAVEAISNMAKVNGLVVTEEQEVTTSTYEDAVSGYAYIINYEEVANQDERYCALRTYALTFILSDEEKAEAGKIVFELVPENELLNLTLSLGMDKYGKVLEEKTTAGELKNVYVIANGENMGVAFELIERVLNENGFTFGTPDENAESEFNATEAYQYIIDGEEPAEVEEEPIGEGFAVEVPVEESIPEVPVDELFKQFRAYVCSFAMFAEEGCAIDRTNDGRVIVRAKLGEEAVETTIDPECDAEAFLFSTVAEFETAKEKVDAVMAKYGFEFNETAQISDVELSEGEMFGYRIKFPPEMTLQQIFNEIRNYANSFAMFVEEGVEPDTSVDGKVVVKAILSENAVAVTVDPEVDAEQFMVEKEADLVLTKEKINGVMAKYGLEVDPDYEPNAEATEGDSFGFRIKF